jgi:glycosyltransferase involved in cell wall biosynthesis
MKNNSDPVTITVVIPNRNDSAFLSTCINSVLRQTVRPDQIIFVDDQSTDDSLDKARTILTGIPESIVLANLRCLGTMGALNEGLKLATCDYVLFLASNDYLVDGIIERVKSSIVELGRPGIWSAMVWEADEEGQCKYVHPSPVIALKDTYFGPDECIRMAMQFGNWATGTTLFFHREELLKIGGFDKEYRGLADLFAALTVASYKGAVFCPHPFGVMRKHSGGYLSDTLSDLNNLESMLAKIEVRGRKLSPNLFNKKFASRTKHRIRFAVMREVGFSTPASVCAGWGGRYNILLAARSILGANRRLMTIVSFIIIRPFDVFSTIWYRLVKNFWIKSWMGNLTNKFKP